jgi:hypothetical protein
MRPSNAVPDTYYTWACGVLPYQHYLPNALSRPELNVVSTTSHPLHHRTSLLWYVVLLLNAPKVRPLMSYRYSLEANH